MEIGTIITWVGAVMFLLPLLFYAGLSIMIIRELMGEDPSLKIIIEIGFALMVVGALILIVQLIF
ncbi:hypothetical protein KKG31_08915 [Patescibacteria group bacterium]|nr:hypothetical protein [Patescibacteria group bacterium]MBU1759172.1 hypothetical protein [Patescibacteria group bacterium]MBU1906718.1 hypothetical protein [Patescibacteria group bacterium]